MGVCSVSRRRSRPRSEETPMTNMARLEKLVAELPEAVRVDVEAWGDHPTFRVRGKNFVFCDQTATHLTIKLPRDEAEAVAATDPRVEPAGYGLGRSGWISVALDERLGGIPAKRARQNVAISSRHSRTTPPPSITHQPPTALIRVSGTSTRRRGR